MVQYDEQWSAGTHAHLQNTDAALDELVEQCKRDQDEDAAKLLRAAGDVLIGCTAAVCSAISDVAAALRERPS